MDFEYGCTITNKYAFFNDSDAEDPSELLAKVEIAKEAKETAKTKNAAAKTKSADAKKAPKKPLQQQTDNSVKATKPAEEGKKEGLIILIFLYYL